MLRDKDFQHVNHKNFSISCSSLLLWFEDQYTNESLLCFSLIQVYISKYVINYFKLSYNNYH